MTELVPFLLMLRDTVRLVAVKLSCVPDRARRQRLLTLASGNVLRAVRRLSVSGSNATAGRTLIILRHVSF